MSGSAILVVDDDAASRELAAEVLETAGHAVATVADGGAALEHLASRPCDLVLTDMRMPGLDGMGLLRALARAGPHPPVIIATAYASIEHAVEAVQAGAYGYITKPFRPDQLARLVGKALEEERLRWENDRLRREPHGQWRCEDLPGQGAGPLPAGGTLADVIAQALRRALVQTGGNRRAAARLLGIPERTFYRKLKTLGLTRAAQSLDAGRLLPAPASLDFLSRTTPALCQAPRPRRDLPADRPLDGGPYPSRR